jgi:imidazolonepropionase-like amidohydrolase
MEGELGSIAAGKRADLVVLAANPLADVSNVRTTTLVVARGKAYASGELWKLVGMRPLAKR